MYLERNDESSFLRAESSEGKVEDIRLDFVRSGVNSELFSKGNRQRGQRIPPFF